MHALAFRRDSRRAQSDFLDRHLRTWLPRFAADARGRLPSGFLKGLVTVTARFVMADRP